MLTVRDKLKMLSMGIAVSSAVNANPIPEKSQVLDSKTINIENEALQQKDVGSTIKMNARTNIQAAQEIIEISKMTAFTSNYLNSLTQDPERNYQAAKLREPSTIITTDELENTSQNNYKPSNELTQLTLEDYQSVTVYKTIREDTRKAIALYALGNHEEADRIIPDFSKKYGDNIVINSINTSCGADTKLQIENDILANFDNIHPDFIKETSQQWQEKHDKQKPTVYLNDNQYIAITMTRSINVENPENMEIAAQKRTKYNGFVNDLKSEKTQLNQNISYLDVINDKSHNQEKTSQYVENAFSEQGELWFIKEGESHLNAEQKRAKLDNIKETVKYDGLDSYFHYKAASSALITPDERKEIANQSNICPQLSEEKGLLPLSHQDYAALSKYNFSAQVTRNALIAVTDGQPEKADKMLPGISDYIKNNVHDTNSTSEAMLVSQESFDKVQDHVIQNIYQIDSQIDHKIQNNYDKRDPQSPTLNPLSEKDLYSFQDKGYFVAFDAPQIQKDMQGFNEKIKNIQNTKPISIEKSYDLPQEKTQETTQEGSQRSNDADLLNKLRGRSDPAQKTGFKESWQKTKESFRDFKNDINQLHDVWKGR